MKKPKSEKVAAVLGKLTAKLITFCTASILFCIIFRAICLWFAPSITADPPRCRRFSSALRDLLLFRRAVF